MKNSILNPINKSLKDISPYNKKFIITYSGICLVLIITTYLLTSWYKDQAFVNSAHQSLSRVVNLYSECTSRPKSQIWSNLEMKMEKSRWSFSASNNHQSIAYILSQESFIDCQHNYSRF